MEVAQRTTEARAEFERSIQLEPAQTESYYELGQIELEVQHDSQAAPLFEKVLARDATHGGALAGMGIIAFRSKDYAQAEQYLARAEKTAPDYQLSSLLSRGSRWLVSGGGMILSTSCRLLPSSIGKQQGPPGAAAEGPSESGTTNAPPAIGLERVPIAYGIRCAAGENCVNCPGAASALTRPICKPRSHTAIVP